MLEWKDSRQRDSFLFLNQNIYVKSHEELIIILKCAWKFGQQWFIVSSLYPALFPAEVHHSNGLGLRCLSASSASSQLFCSDS